MRPGTGRRVGVLVVLDALDERASRSCRLPRLLPVPNPSGLLIPSGVRLCGGAGRVTAWLLVAAAAARRSIRSEQPSDLALDGLHAVPLELGGVAVDLAPRCGAAVLHPLEPLLQPASAGPRGSAAGSPVGAAEEGEAHAEVLVLPRGGPASTSACANCSLPAGGELVDDRAAAGADAGASGVGARPRRSSRREASSSAPGRASRRTAPGPSRAPR